MPSPILERSHSATVATARLAPARPAVPAELRITDNPAAAVLRAATRGPIFRDIAAQATGLSIATVNRQVSALLSAGLLRERADYLVDRYSERKESAEALSKRVNQRSI